MANRPTLHRISAMVATWVILLFFMNPSLLVFRESVPAAAENLCFLFHYTGIAANVNGDAKLPLIVRNQRQFDAGQPSFASSAAVCAARAALL